VTAADSGLTDSGSSAWSYDPDAPIPNISFTGVSGSNGWYVSTIHATAGGTDSVSGIASALLSTDGGTHAISMDIITDGIHTVDETVIDNAGNSAATSVPLKIDTIAPQVTSNATGTLGSSGWYGSAVQVSAAASDVTSGLASFLVNIDGTWTAYTSPVVLGGGTHSVQFRAIDNAGNIKTTPSQIFQVDLSAPIVTPVISGTSGSNGWYTSVVQVSASATDTGSGLNTLKIAVDGGTWQSYTAPIQLSTDGHHTVQFQAIDKAGNSSTPGVSVKMDAAPPQITVGSPIGTPGLNGWYVSDVQVSASASDVTSGLASLMISVDGVWSAYSSAVTLGDGMHKVQFQAADNAGKLTISPSQTYQVDTAAPLITTSIIGTSASSGWYVSNTQVHASASDAGSGLGSLKFSLDGGAWQSYTAAVALNDGQHTVQFQAMDGAGNSSTSSVAAKVDTTAPQISMDSVVGTPGLNAWYITNVQIAATASDVTSGLAAFMINVDGVWSAYSMPITLGNGSHTIQFRATDHAGMVSTTAPQTYNVDVNAPDITTSMSGTDGINGWHISDVEVDASANDSGSGVGSLKFAVDGNAWQTFSTPIPLTNGQHTVQFLATDQAGNSVTRNVPVKIDTLDPTISKSFSTSEVGGWYAKAPVLSVSAVDLGAGLDTLLVLDNGVLTGNPVSLTDGIHDITITAADLAGNSSSDSFTVRVDTTPPVITPSIIGTLGDHGWYVSSVDVNSVFSDETSGVSSTVTLINGSILPLPYALTDDNKYTVIFNATDNAGNMVSQAVPVNVDQTLPIMEVSRTGTSGKNGWYTSAVDLHVTATDVTSGQQYAEYRLDGGVWKVGMLVTVSGDGMHTVDYRVFDQAGNVADQSETLKIDATAPSVSFLSPSENTPVDMVVRLSGTASDAGSSGLDSVEVSLDRGNSWNPVSAGDWTYDWNVARFPNGLQSAWVRAQDAAGNVSVPTILNLLVDTSGPYISLADPWSFDLAGELKIIPNVYDVKTVSIKVTNSDGTLMLSSQHTNDLPAIVWWNGQYNNQQQPAGTYPVLVIACDLFDVCSTAKSAIHIPVFYYDDPPKPPATPEVIVPSSPLILPITETAAPPQLMEIKVSKEIRNRNMILFLVSVFFTLLFLGNSVLDPRPRANIKLANAIQKFIKENPKP